MKANNQASSDQISAVRSFNRFYTRKLGILAPKLLHSAWTLQEARLIYEIGERRGCTASDLVRGLGVDAGYLSRTLKSLEQRQIVTRKSTPTDKRSAAIALTAKGRAAFSDLQARSHGEIGELLGPLDEADRDAVIAAMAQIEAVLEPQARPPRSFQLRSHRPGDIGWVVSRHGATYAQEYGWDISFEALVAEIGAQFIKNYNAAREHCWIAIVGGHPVGSIFIVDGGDDVAKLRLLLVEQKARGLGVGRALVDECIHFARRAGYRKISLWTQSILIAARGIYEQAGFVRTAEEPHHSFGVDLVGETWELTL